MKDEATSPEPARDASRIRNIVRGIGSLSVQGVLSALLGFVLLASLLRFLPSVTYGAYSSLSVSLSIVSVLSVFGLSAAVVRFLAPASPGGNSSGWGAAKASLILNVAFSAIASLALVAIAPYLSVYFMKDPTWSWVFYLGALWLFTSSVSTLLQGMLQAIRKYSLLAKVLLASRVAAVALAVVGLLLYQSLSIAILSWVVYGALLSLTVLFLVWKPLRNSSSRSHYGEVLRYAAPLGLATIIAAVASNADIVVVGGYLNPTSLGVYNATIVISTVLSSLFIVPLVTALFAETSFSSETPVEVSRGVALALRFSTLTVLPASLFAAAVAPQLFYLFSGGGAYTVGIPYLQLITFFYLFVAVQSVAIYVLQGVGRTREVLVVGLITALSDIGLSVSLVPSLGLAGAAVSRVVVMAAGCFISLYFIRGYLKGAINYGFFAKALVSSGVPAAVVFMLSSMLSARLISLLPYTILGLALFFGCARALRLLSAEDKSFVSHLLPARFEWVARLL